MPKHKQAINQDEKLYEISISTAGITQIVVLKSPQIIATIAKNAALDAGKSKKLAKIIFKIILERNKSLHQMMNREENFIFIPEERWASYDQSAHITALNIIQNRELSARPDAQEIYEEIRKSILDINSSYYSGTGDLSYSILPGTELYEAKNDKIYKMEVTENGQFVIPLKTFQEIAQAAKDAAVAAEKSEADSSLIYDIVYHRNKKLQKKLQHSGGLLTNEIINFYNKSALKTVNELKHKAIHMERGDANEIFENLKINILDINSSYYSGTGNMKYSLLPGTDLHILKQCRLPLVSEHMTTEKTVRLTVSPENPAIMISYNEFYQRRRRYKDELEKLKDHPEAYDTALYYYNLYKNPPVLSGIANANEHEVSADNDHNNDNDDNNDEKSETVSSVDSHPMDLDPDSNLEEHSFPEAGAINLVELENDYPDSNLEEHSFSEAVAIKLDELKNYYQEVQVNYNESSWIYDADTSMRMEKVLQCYEQINMYDYYNSIRYYENISFFRDAQKIHDEAIKNINHLLDMLREIKNTFQASSFEEKQIPPTQDEGPSTAFLRKIEAKRHEARLYIEHVRDLFIDQLPYALQGLRNKPEFDDIMAKTASAFRTLGNAFINQLNEIELDFRSTQDSPNILRQYEARLDDLEKKYAEQFVRLVEAMKNDLKSRSASNVDSEGDIQMPGPNSPRRK